MSIDNSEVYSTTQDLENMGVSDSAESTAPQPRKKSKPSKAQPRRSSRTEAFILVFEKSFKDTPIADIIDTDTERARPDEYMLAVLALLDEKASEIDTIISSRSKKWEISRLSRVTLAVLRLAIAELMTGREPTAVIINEAVELAKMYGSSEDASYINGILVTLAVLRLAIAELMTGREPTAVIINEAVELAKMYGSSEDASYINGILGGYVRDESRDNS